MDRKIITGFNRMKQKVDQLGRSEKSEILTKEMEDSSQLLQTMHEICQILSKKLKDGIQIHPGEPEKRQKKTQEWILAQTLRECSQNLNKNHGETYLGEILNKSAEVEELLAKEQIQFEMHVDEKVLRPLTELEADYKSISKTKKHLQKLSADMDAAKRKYNSAARQSSVPNGSDNSGAKLTQMKEELDEITKQVDHTRDAFTTDVLNMTARQGEFSDLMMKHVQLKTDYHRQALKIFDVMIPDMANIHGLTVRPLFGAPLKDELLRRKSKIAHVLDTCASFLYRNSLEEEGLFRIAGSISKVKMLKAAFDAQVGNDDNRPQVLELMNYDSDHHSVASTLKCYLRELPEPLTTVALYDDWMEAVKVEDQENRAKALAEVINQLPVENYDNLSYLIRFLAAVAARVDKNKMSASNLAIVMAPNLFWNSDGDRNRLDMSDATLQHIVVEALINQQKELFPGDFEAVYELSMANNPEPKDSSSLDLTQSGGSESGGSPRPITPPETPYSPKLTKEPKPPLKAKKAPAPPPAIPKRTENVLPASAVPPSNAASNSPAISNSVPEDPIKLYPDISSIVVKAAVFEPTVLPVPYYSPASIAPPSPSSPGSSESPFNRTASPNPFPRRRVLISAVVKDSNSSSEGSSENGHEISHNGTLNEENSRPRISQGRPPPPPPRHVSENTTYL